MNYPCVDLVRLPFLHFLTCLPDVANIVSVFALRFETCVPFL